MHSTSNTMKPFRNSTTLAGFGVDATSLDQVSRHLKIGEVYGFDYDEYHTMGTVKLHPGAKEVLVCGFVQAYPNESTWYVLGYDVKQPLRHGAAISTHHPSRFTIQTMTELKKQWKREDNAKQIGELQDTHRQLTKRRMVASTRKAEYVRSINEVSHYMQNVTKEIAGYTDDINEIEKELIKLGGM